MRGRRFTQLSILILAAGFAGAGLETAPVSAAPPTVSSAPATSSASTLYVAAKNCVPGGDGSHDAPFCTISAAAAVAQPGQTVLVEPGNYPENVTLTQSGTSTAPITFQAVDTANGIVSVGALTTTISGSVLTVSHVHDIVISGFMVFGALQADAVVIDGSTNVTVDSSGIQAVQAVGVRVTGASSDVTISRNWLRGSGGVGPRVAIDAGVAGAVVTRNQFGVGATSVAVTGAPGTVITGNTMVTGCTTAISVTAGSTGASIQNNIVDTALTAPASPSACANPATATGISVSADSVTNTVADYNLIDPASGGALYDWGGTAYTDLSAFGTATGQGGHDIAADPRMGIETGGNFAYYPIDADSPAIDSGMADAPGEPAGDMLGNPRTDDPDVTNTGTGVGYQDRGALELEGPVDAGPGSLQHNVRGGPLDVVAAAAHRYQWVADGPGGTFAFQFDDDPFPVVTDALTVEHTFRQAGKRCVTVYVSEDRFRTASGIVGTNCTVLGAVYTPVTPTRVLDTRSAIGVGTTTPVRSGADVVLPISIGSVPAADITAVVLNVTVTEPTTAGYLTVYPDGYALPNASNLNFVAGQTVPNLVTVQMTDGKVRFHNGAGGTVHIVADLEGYYSGTGYGFKAMSPLRVLDTRDGTGTGTTNPVPGGGKVRLDLSGSLPADATAAVLNVTATQPVKSGFVTVYPDGGSVPNASNLNFVANQTVPNLVMVPVVKGWVDFYNASSGSVHLLADLAGYFGTAASGATQSYVPLVPTRIADTRTGSNPAPLAAKSQLPVVSTWISDCFKCPQPTGLILNVTATDPTTVGFLTAYPDGEARPNASNLNFLAGQTVPNLAAVKVSDRLIDVYNASGGSVDVVVDQEGYFIDV